MIVTVIFIFIVVAAWQNLFMELGVAKVFYVGRSKGLHLFLCPHPLIYTYCAIAKCDLESIVVMVKLDADIFDVGLTGDLACQNVGKACVFGDDFEVVEVCFFYDRLHNGL